MSTKREIIQLGHPVLRKKARRVVKIQSDFIRCLVDDLFVTMNEADGVGIAAPQVAESYRLFIVAPQSNPRYPDVPDIEPIVVINPEITWFSDEKEEDWEGCLSVPEVRGLVPRAKNIRIAYTTQAGVECKATFSDFTARVFQHEYDHLQGIIFVDRAIKTVNEKDLLHAISTVE